MQKIWAYLELVLNSAGLRVKLKKVGGLFSKTDRVKRYPRTWTVRSQYNGSDSLASRSNRVRPKRSPTAAGGSASSSGVAAAAARVLGMCCGIGWTQGGSRGC